MEREGLEALKLDIAEISGQLNAIAQRLDQLADLIPEPEDDVLEGRAPWTLEAEIKGTLYCVSADDVRGASEALAELALATPESIREAWEQRRGRAVPG